MLTNVFTAKNLIFLAVLCAAFLVTYLFSPVTKRIAERTGALDIPDGKRKKHKSPTPRLGGLAIAVGFTLIACLGSYLLTGKITKETMVMAVGGVVICIVGMIDDIFDLPALVKLLAQTSVAVMTVFFGGAMEYITVFGKTIVFGAWAIPVSAVWIILIVNAVNLIDGLDGLACGVSCLSAFSILIIALMMKDVKSAIIAASLCGAALGFLPYNANPAAIFMGDCGSMLFGYILACLSVFGLFKGATLISAVAPALIFALPLVDGLYAFFYRVIKKKNPFKADRSHLHYKLTDIGFSQRGAVALIYIATALLCASSIISLRSKKTALIIAAAVCIIMMALKHGDKFGIKKKKAQEKTPPEIK